MTEGSTDGEDWECLDGLLDEGPIFSFYSSPILFWYLVSFYMLFLFSFVYFLVVFCIIGSTFRRNEVWNVATQADALVVGFGWHDWY